MIRMLAAVAALSMLSPAVAQIAVTDAWVAAPVAGQRTAAAYMTLRPAVDARVTSIASPVAGVAEIHEMKMDGNVMRMRPVRELALRAGASVELKPGGLHVMLMDMNRSLAAGERVALELRVELDDGRRLTLPVSAEVRASALGGGAAHRH